ncbi:MAG: phosphoenolpyruvate carboxylase, partial [Crenarchaeota archaeon]|nr:phosphoenolpyruvate carboxylase [Thermoproteota archaeon]
LSTVTIQSSLKYDYPIEQVKNCIKVLNRRLPNGEPIVIESSEEGELIMILHKSRRVYEKIVEELAPLINSVASYVPARRARKLHIGLFGYSRRIRNVILPRAIPFAAALYSLGIPPELLGCRILTELKEDEWKLMEKHYVNLKHDLETASGYLSWRNIELIKETCKLLAEKACMGVENLRSAINEILSDLNAIEKTFGIHLGPRTNLEKKHENFINNFLLSYIEGDEAGASTYLVEAAKIRRCLG